MFVETPWKNQKPQYGTQINPRHPLCPTACWLFNEGAGPTLFDTASTYNSTAVNNPSWGGGALSFTTASSTYCDAGNVLDIGTTDLSVVCWLKVGSTYAPTLVGIVGKTLAGSSTGRYAILFDGVGVGPGNIAGLSQLGSAVETPGLSGLNDGNWHQLALVIDRPNNVMRLFADGGRLSTSATIVGSVGTNYTISNSLRFGSYDNSSSVAANFLTGSIGLVGIYKRALSAGEVQSLFADPYCFMQPRRVWVPDVSTVAVSRLLKLRRQMAL